MLRVYRVYRVLRVFSGFKGFLGLMGSTWMLMSTYDPNYTSTLQPTPRT